MIGIGIDTGGTYTDAVAFEMEKKQVLCAGKSLTTKENLEIGISNALDTLDSDLLARAELIALSTTLATNACVENKGSRAKLLYIGVDENNLVKFQSAFEKYGFDDMEQLVFLDGKPEKIYQNPQDPNWEEFDPQIPQLFQDCDAVGVTQVYPYANGGRFEIEAREHIRRKLEIPVTTAYDLFQEVDVLKRGASTLLNARLIPLIAEFLQAVKHVLQKRNLSIPIAVVKSDGSLFSEAAAKQYPVETLISGPAASVVGGTVLTRERDALVVDMGGTTTDLILVRDNLPNMAEEGIQIGQWRTMVKGLEIDTVLLGGDVAVRHREGHLILDDCKVMPISHLAKRYPQVTGRLLELKESKKSHSRNIHEWYVLQKPETDFAKYSDTEGLICHALKDGPLLLEELAEKIDGSVYSLPTKRLESEGVILRAGLTPTDMMLIKGDFKAYNPAAARVAVSCLAFNLTEEESQIPDHVYQLVEEKLYCQISKALLNLKYPREKRLMESPQMEQWIFHNYQESRKEEHGLIDTCWRAEIPLISVGAPTHVFLPKVAKLLGTAVQIPQYASVANAVGAISSKVNIHVKIPITLEYEAEVLKGYSLFVAGKKYYFSDYEAAETFGKKEAERQTRDRARMEGNCLNPSVAIRVERKMASLKDSDLLVEIIVHGHCVLDYQ